MLTFHAEVVDGIYMRFKRSKGRSYCTHCGELDYVNTNWNEVVLERTCQDICSARTTK